MSTPEPPVVRGYHSAREHLAGVKAAAAWIHELAAAHLLRTQEPISSEPTTTPGGQQP